MINKFIMRALQIDEKIKSELRLKVIQKSPGIICPVIAYAPIREVIPIIAQRPLVNSADSALNSLTTLMWLADLEEDSEFKRYLG